MTVAQFLVMAAVAAAAGSTAERSIENNSSVTKDDRNLIQKQSSRLAQT